MATPREVLNPIHTATQPQKRFWKISHAAKLLAAGGLSQFISPAGDWLPLIHSLPKSDTKRIALSFDDGPAPHTTRRVAHILARYNANATFFLSGARASKNPDLIDVLVKAGHDVFGHGWTHIRYQTPDQVISNLEQVESLLRQHRPTPSPYLVRLPYAEGRRQQWMHRAIRQWNPKAQIADWTYWLKDWEIPSKCRNRSDLARVCRLTLEKLSELPELDGAILLLHEEPYDVGSPLNSFVILVLLEQLLDRFRQLSYSFVPIMPWATQPLVTKFLLNSRRFRLGPRGSVAA